MAPLWTWQVRREYSDYLCNTRELVEILILGRFPVRTISMHVEAWSALERVLLHNGYGLAKNVGSYNCRNIGGTTRKSTHAYRCAIDIDAPQNWVQTRDEPMDWSRAKLTEHQVLMVEAIRTNSGDQVFRNGYVFRTPDPMHFQIAARQAAFATGIDWSTVDGGLAPPPPPPSEETEMFCEYGDGIDGQGDTSLSRMEVVKSWQLKLEALGQDTGQSGDTFDGKYWDKTKVAVMAIVPGSDGMQIAGVESGAIDVALGLLGPGAGAHGHDEYATVIHEHETVGHTTT